MKKILGLMFVGLFLVGCSNEPAKVMTCTYEENVAGMNLSVDTEITYEGEKVTVQKQASKIVVEDEATYAEVLKEAKKAAGEQTEMEGVIYEFKENNDNREITEVITIDFSKVSDEDYVKVSGDSSITLSKNIILIDKTKERLESQGMTCQL